MSTITNTSAPIVPFEVLLAKMEPHFRFFARRVLRLKADNLDDALQDMRAIAFGFYRSLVRRGKEAFYTPIMKFAIKRYKSGRHFTGSNSTDILADQTRMLGRSKVHSLSRFGIGNNPPNFMVDPKMNVADTVQFKIDFHETWYYRQSPRDQRIIDDLAIGETTNAVAKKCGVSASLISTKRKDLANSWKRFIDPPEEEMTVLA
jgi:hypothetical protein